MHCLAMFHYSPETWLSVMANLVQTLSIPEILHGLKHSGKTNVNVAIDLKGFEYLSSPFSFYLSSTDAKNKKIKTRTWVQFCEQKNHILVLKSAREKCSDKFKALIV